MANFVANRDCVVEGRVALCYTNSMEKIATDIYTFSEFRGRGFTDVDKTEALYAMTSVEMTGVTS